MRSAIYRLIADGLIRLRQASSFIEALCKGLYAWFDLAMRIWLAQVVLAQAAISVVMDRPMTMAGHAPAIETFNHLVQSPFGFAVEFICPALLLIGLATRLAAIPLLIEVLVLLEPGMPLPMRLTRSALLGWLIIRGPGALSIDGVMGQGLDSSAIPGVRVLSAVWHATTLIVGPWYLLLFRVWIAATPAMAALSALGWRDADLQNWFGSWLNSIPTMAFPLSTGLSLIIACLLTLGLATRLAVLSMLAALAIGAVGVVGDDRLSWGLVLAALLLRGAGWISLDHLVSERLARVMRAAEAPQAGLPHVVILGGGFGGIAAARGLARLACRITLVDRRNYHLFQPLLYQVATAGLSPADIAAPIRGMLRTQANIRVLFGEAVGIRAAAREVLLAHAAPLPYDVLILATGSRHSYFGQDRWAADAPGLKSIEDATDIRRRLLLAFERAESCGDAIEAKAWMTFVIVGGGPTGVELAGAIAELARHGLADEFRAVDPAGASVILVQSAPQLLPSFPPSLAADAEAVLRELGVEVRLGSKVEAVDSAGILLSGQRIEARTVLWAAGVEASPAGRWLGAATDRAGRILVGPDLTVPGFEDIYAIGDLAASSAWNGRPVPGLAPAAKQAGSYVAGAVAARLKGRPAPKPFRYRHLGSLATIGRQAAVADFGALRFRRALAWWIWGIVHVMFLVGFRNRLTVMFAWAWAYLTYRRGTRLITEPAAMPAPLPPPG